MIRENVLKDKSLAFAIRIVNLNKYLVSDKNEFVMSKQILRSGTSVGDIVREAEFGQSKPDFIHKLAISQKEINETIFWLELLQATQYIDRSLFESMHADAVGLIKLITSSIKTVKSKL